MKIAAGVLVHNIYRYERLELFKQTVESLAAQNPDYLYLVSNGSNDGTEDYIAKLGGTVVDDPVTTCGHGMNVTIGICAASGADLVVFSNDDIDWKPGSLNALRRFWTAADPDISIASALLEDHFPWNTIQGRVVFGGVPALVRNTAPGGAWSLRAADWPMIGPVPEAAGWDDVPTCDRLRERGNRVCQIDLADHLGQDKSTWGNGSAAFGTPLDPELRESLRVPAL